MNKLSEVQNTLENLKVLIKQACGEVYQDYLQKETLENSLLLTILENTDVYTIDDLLSIFNYFTSSEFIYSGVLGIRPDGKYEIVGTDKYFLCGSTIEIFAVENENDYLLNYFKWHVGRIEYKESLNGYYFHNEYGLNIRLEQGMKARVRKVNDNGYSNFNADKGLMRNV